MQKLIVITGPSATGKTSIGNFLIDKNHNLEKVKTCTTRNKRSEDDDYIFLSIKDFKEKINNNEFIEWEEVYEGNYYGLLHSEIKSAWLKNSVPVLVMDIKGALKIKELFKENCISFFINSKKEDLIERLNKRGSDKNINERLTKMDFELSFQNSFDYNVINNDMFVTYKYINDIINNFCNNTKLSETIVVNLYAGPGTGKSTMASAIFSELKFKNINTELCSEYAKDKVWENSLNVLKNQIYIFGKQHHRLYRLLNEVDIIITDSPILMQQSYTNDSLLKTLIYSEYNKMNNIDILLTRTKEYNPKGRTQTYNEALEKDKEIKQILNNNGINYFELESKKDNIEKIIEIILNHK